MFALYELNDLNYYLLPEDYPFILNPDDALRKAEKYYDMEPCNQMLGGMTIIPARKFTQTFYHTPNDYNSLRHNPVYENIKRGLEMGTIIGIDVMRLGRRWSSYFNLFYVDVFGDLTLNARPTLCYSPTSIEWIIRSYDECRRRHNIKRPRPTEWIYLSESDQKKEKQKVFNLISESLKQLRIHTNKYRGKQFPGTEVSVESVFQELGISNYPTLEQFYKFNYTEPSKFDYTWIQRNHIFYESDLIRYLKDLLRHIHLPCSGYAGGRSEKNKDLKPPKPSAPEQTGRYPVDAGFCIVPDVTTPKKYNPLLFVNPPPKTKELYNQLNPEMKKQPGAILIVVDPDKQDSKQIKTLTEARDRIDSALKPLTHEEAKLLYDNRAAVDIFSSQIYSDALGTSGDILGYVSEMGKSYYDEINKILEEIQKLYQNTYSHNNGIISGQEFFGQRQRLFDRLNVVLNRFSKSQLNLREYENIKKALGLSTSSIMHRWDQTGVREIEGYASYIEKSAKLIKILRNVGYVGIGLDFASYSNNVYEACAKGREDECRKAALVEYGKFGGKQLSSLAAGGTAGWAARSTCLWALGLVTVEAGGVGSGLCLVTGVAASIAGGYFAEDLGENTGGFLGGEIIYDKLFGGK